KSSCKMSYTPKIIIAALVVCLASCSVEKSELFSFVGRLGTYGL
ncbi:hypothetical protein HMPREF1860_00852, partial [Prevotella amnii]